MNCGTSLSPPTSSAYRSRFGVTAPETAGGAAHPGRCKDGRSLMPATRRTRRPPGWGRAPRWREQAEDYATSEQEEPKENTREAIGAPAAR
ncbi:hypothetical protein GUJ93_ZPchr0013g37730 [Zizania palustris]|uniref:Uncharacterized protein n=1 Tax=Zizania palustris TaxID=103762 RepID=A0A8J6C4U4_ZIZPA|nr:hypothetical protein GUJ93_ZPchr0013g37730 [Zizania palustris]